MAGALARPTANRVRRLRLRVRGAVQGVGFRPFAYRLARTMRLSGFVLNDSAGVLIEIEGPDAGRFPDAIRTQAPPLARIDSIDVLELTPAGGERFEILESVSGRTGKGCHLDAHMVGHAAEELAPEPGSVLFIENVG
ncbi:acylphosphatase, partial [Sinorhizobium sp. 7-81]|uniref:acylphosphatase n=1 Tax=Sinorhizobium sp. 8-89 TaxID=3049089 RepID=UPI0024C25CD3